MYAADDLQQNATTTRSHGGLLAKLGPVPKALVEIAYCVANTLWMNVGFVLLSAQ